MYCKFHTTTTAEDRCAGCAEPFCHNCLVELSGQKYCASCKVMTVKGPPPIEDGDEPCDAANKALTFSIVGCFCFGFVFGPLAVVKAIEARKQIREDPRMAGIAKANIGLLLGIVVTISWAIGMIAKVKGGFDR